MRSTLRQLRRSGRRTRRAAPREVRHTSDNEGSRFDNGFRAGYEEGKRSGAESFDTLFDGTSIIIPTYNQGVYLKSCIESIVDHTDLPYEIIVVDNGSTDETGSYLQEIGAQIRCRILDQNRGFAGAVNAGLMMAKGTTLVLLNNDTLVTENWLDNMLACLHSDERIGLVGPVTNYISGDQKIEVPYTEIEDMYDFAKLNNVSNPAKWIRTDRLTGFCLLFRRELLERTGYLDEGYEIGNYEDDDYNIRVRLQGYALVIAQDAFIHHFGSVSIKALGDRLNEVNHHNMQYYMDKWGNPHELVHRVNEWRARKEQSGESGSSLFGQTDFYPQRAFVKGVGDTVFWLDQGKRRPLGGTPRLPVVRISQFDLRRYPIGEEVSNDDPQLQPSYLMHGARYYVAEGNDGNKYAVEDGKKRLIVSAAAAERWGYTKQRAIRLSESALQELPDGLPVILPVTLHQTL
ncbi:glycosyltransferase family 2 protein [Paenibacillus kobensis]|uniref:glycosyltransferase family 2 protein n=1 Tax=Paenibacillus kobensis TaxID=59841 RepID=UPI001FEB31BA|nr:glycosyltransferase family 2 protein [Paenibacillus kobensis]